MDIEGIEWSCIDEKSRTKLYFAHPYTACKKERNENHNRILCHFFSKCCNFSKVSDEEVARVELWMNNYQKRIHGGKTPAMIYKNFAISDRKLGSLPLQVTKNLRNFFW